MSIAFTSQETSSFHFDAEEIETAPIGEGGDMKELAYSQGYLDPAAFSALLEKRWGQSGDDLLAGLEKADFSVDSSIPYGSRFAVRYAATETEFASKVRILAIFDMGDADMNGNITSADASLILRHYAANSSGGEAVIEKEAQQYCDMDGNGNITSNDASEVLKKYAKLSC